MESTSILLAGLPAAGKSTYIAALWAVEKDGKSGHLLSCDERPSDSSYVDGMSDNWTVLEKVRRTTFAEPMEIVLPMKKQSTGKKIYLSLPDFKGEIFQQILGNSVSSDVVAWCEKSQGILFMLNLGNYSPEFFQEQISDTTKPKVELEKAVLLPNDIDPVIQNILLLKYLYSKMGNCPIALCFSSWDSTDYSDGQNVEEWVKANHPCIYNFVSAHFTKYRYYGISAQGADYSELDEKSSDELAEKATRKERAFVYRDRISYDITEPLDFLILE
jgi:hypothetical protein